MDHNDQPTPAEAANEASAGDVMNAELRRVAMTIRMTAARRRELMQAARDRDMSLQDWAMEAMDRHLGLQQDLGAGESAK